MKYVIGVDGGGTKTRGILLDYTGKLIADYTTSGSNYQIIGESQTEAVLKDVILHLTAQIPMDAVQFIHYGLSGADLPCDFNILEAIAGKISPNTPFEVANDTWCVLRSGLNQTWGAVSLYGTGANAAAVNPNGERSILRALGYAAGGIGGGDELSLSALHFAFRSEEGTYKKSGLETGISKLLGVTCMAEVVDLVYPHFTIPMDSFKQIPPLIFDLAASGDCVANEILTSAGKTQGELVLGMIRRAGIRENEVPVVLGGSVFKGSSPVFIDAMMSTIQEVYPEAYPVTPALPPVAGAGLLALDQIRCDNMAAIYDNLHRSFSL